MKANEINCATARELQWELAERIHDVRTKWWTSLDVNQAIEVARTLQQRAKVPNHEKGLYAKIEGILLGLHYQQQAARGAHPANLRAPGNQPNPTDVERDTALQCAETCQAIMDRLTVLSDTPAPF
jgi:hypothetical protein